jgi:GDP-L-fucose synthase
LFLGSSCIYPRECPQPIKEEYLLTGPLEPTNRPYAVAKIAGIEMCWAYNRQYGTRYLAVMPTNLYGIGDNFDLATSHVLPALIRKMHDAKQARQSEVVVWGSGEPLREFLFSDDLADACITLMGLNDDRIAQLTNPSTLPLVNIGVGKDITIRELAELVREVVGFEGQLSFDRSKPDGTPRKLLDVSRMSSLGWQASTSLRTGIDRVYRWYRAQPGR